MKPADTKWTRRERMSFMVQISQQEIGMEYDQLAAACESIGWPRPSMMHDHHRMYVIAVLTWRDPSGPMAMQRQIIEHRYRVAVEAEILDQVAYDRGFSDGYQQCQDEAQHTAGGEE